MHKNSKAVQESIYSALIYTAPLRALKNVLCLILGWKEFVQAFQSSALNIQTCIFSQGLIHACSRKVPKTDGCISGGFDLQQ